MDVVTRTITQLFNPRHHKWSKHFRLEGAYLIARTAIGRVTVALLRINDEHRLRLRETLIAEGAFPPPQLSRDNRPGYWSAGHVR